MRLGASFSPRRARQAGLDWQASFKQLLTLGLDPIRLSAYWDEVDQDGYGSLDWQLDEVARAGRHALLSVGMKAQGWPEFYIPQRLVPTARRCADVAASSAALRSAALDLLHATVQRYLDHPALLAWQVENEPFNRSGPNRWWIGPDFLRQEMAAVRAGDPGRPRLLTAFGHFNLVLDIVSNPWRLGIGRLLELLGPGDVLGLDVYVRIGHRLAIFEGVARAASNWADEAARWRTRAEAAGAQAWIAEAQAEPWEATPATSTQPRSFLARDIPGVVAALRGAGFQTVLLWGCEYWLARAAAGDRSWLETVLALPQP